MGTLRSVSRNIRRVSVRVVNLAGITLEDKPIRLDDDDPPPEKGDHLDHLTQEESNQETSVNRLRGRTLGVFGPTSGFRRTMLSLLLWKYGSFCFPLNSLLMCFTPDGRSL